MISPLILGRNALNTLSLLFVLPPYSAEKWMDEKEADQEKMASHEMPVFKSSDVEPALKGLKNLVVKLSKRPAPKKEKPVKADNSTEEAGGESDSGEASSSGEGDTGMGNEGENVDEGDEGQAEGERPGNGDRKANGSVDDEL